MTSDLVFGLMLSVIGKYHLIILVINKEKLVRGKKNAEETKHKL